MISFFIGPKGQRGPRVGVALHTNNWLGDCRDLDPAYPQLQDWLEGRIRTLSGVQQVQGNSYLLGDDDVMELQLLTSMEIIPNSKPTRNFLAHIRANPDQSAALWAN